MRQQLFALNVIIHPECLQFACALEAAYAKMPRPASLPNVDLPLQLLDTFPPVSHACNIARSSNSSIFAKHAWSTRETRGALISGSLTLLGG